MQNRPTSKVQTCSSSSDGQKLTKRLLTKFEYTL